MSKISIIIPVYNVEKYLHKCIKSILAQTFQDLEVILINDGSTDSSGKICDEYAEKDKRIIVIHQCNQGVSAARNKGLSIAQGEYIGFVDPDDYVAEDMFEFLYTNMKTCEADISVCGMYHCYADGRIISPSRCISKLCSREESIAIILDGRDFGISLNNKLFKRNVIGNYFFKNEISYGEDGDFTFRRFVDASKIFFDSTPKYYYVHRQGSATTSDAINSYQNIDVCKNILNLISKELPELIPVAYRRLWWAHRQCLTQLLLEKNVDQNKYNEDINLMTSKIRKGFFSILLNRAISLKEKVAYFLIVISPQVYIMVVKFKRRNNRIIE